MGPDRLKLRRKQHAKAARTTQYEELEVRRPPGHDRSASMRPNRQPQWSCVEQPGPGDSAHRQYARIEFSQRANQLRDSLTLRSSSTGESARDDRTTFV